MDTTDQEEQEQELKAKMVGLLEHYFSDFSLQLNTQLRAFLQTNNDLFVSIDQILTLTKVRELVGGDRAKLLSIVRDCAPQLHFAYFAPDREQIGRRPDLPFVYNKHYLREHADSVIYLNKLPKACTVSDIHEWAVGFSPCWVQPIKRTADHSVRTALVVFSKQESVQEIMQYQLVASGKGYYYYSLSRGDELLDMTLKWKVNSYQDYLKRKNKAHKGKRNVKRMTEFTQHLSLHSDLSTNYGSPSKLTGFNSLIVKRSLQYVNHTKTVFYKNLKAALAQYGVIFVYTIGQRECDGQSHFVLFKNRSALTRFVEQLKESQIKVWSYPEQEEIQLCSDDFCHIESAQITDHFWRYAKLVKAYMRQTLNAPKND